MTRRAAARPPLDRDAVMDDLREVLLGIACQMSLVAGDDGPAEAFIGIDLNEFSLGSMPGGHREMLRDVDLTRFHVARQIGAAFDFALQTGDAGSRSSFDEDDWNDIALFVEGGPRCSYGGEPTPLFDEESDLRRTLDMALARMTLRHGGSLTIRQLALLADIGETAVRTSLSSEGIRTEGKPATVPAEIAEPWLHRRRGYVPIAEQKNTDVQSDTQAAARLAALPFPQALAEMMDDCDMDVAELAQKAEVDEIWLRALLDGGAVACDLDGLCRMAERLKVEVPTFVGRAVEDILGRK